MFGFSCAEWTIPNVLIRIVVSMILGCVIGLDRGLKKRGAGTKTNTIVCLGSNAGYVDGAVYGGIFSREIGSFAYGIAGDQRGRISWSRNHHCVRTSGEGTDNCGKFMGMCMRLVLQWGSGFVDGGGYHYGVCTDFPSRASTSGKIFFSAQ
mgnify:CR=1 FL=1